MQSVVWHVQHFSILHVAIVVDWDILWNMFLRALPIVIIPPQAPWRLPSEHPYMTKMLAIIALGQPILGFINHPP
jgi:hypothetical protein